MKVVYSEVGQILDENYNVLTAILAHTYIHLHGPSLPLDQVQRTV